MDDELILTGMTEREISIRRRVHRLAEFYRHAFIYVFANTVMWAMNLWMLGGGFAQAKWYAYWAIWPTLGWGIGLVTHGLSVLPVWSFCSQDWEDKKVKELLAREDDRVAK